MLECICIDVQSGLRWKENVPELKEDIYVGECSDEMLSEFFKNIEKPIFQESDFQALGKSHSMYFAYVRLKNSEEKKNVKENIGMRIYSSLKGC